jgi:hypothetical protein
LDPSYHLFFVGLAFVDVDPALCGINRLPPERGVAVVFTEG